MRNARARARMRAATVKVVALDALIAGFLSRRCILTFPGRGSRQSVSHPRRPGNWSTMAHDDGNYTSPYKADIFARSHLEPRRGRRARNY